MSENKLTAPPSGETAARAANRFNWRNDVAPEADLEVPDGHIPVRMANAGTVSTGNVLPLQVLTLPAEEAARLVRDGLAHPVRAVPRAGRPTAHVDPTEIRRASLRDQQHDDGHEART